MLTTPRATAASGVITMPAAGSNDWFSDSTRPWNTARRVPLQQSACRYEEGGVDAPQEDADQRDDL